MNRRPTTIEIRLDPTDFRRWQDHVVATLAATPGIELRVVPTSRRHPAPAGVDLLFSLERSIARGLWEASVDRLDSSTLSRFAGPARPADLVVDLVGDGEPGRDGLFLQLDCDGSVPLDGAVAAILDARTPVLTARLVVEGTARTVARWPVAVEEPLSATRSASLILGRAAHLVVAAVEALRAAADPADVRLAVAAGDDGLEAAAPPRRDLAALGFFARALTTRIARRLTRLCGRAPTWSIVWRRRTPGIDPRRPDLDDAPFHRLLDDGRRFYADPFLWAEGDRVHLFCEEFPFATGKGIISVATIEADGRVGPMRPVLEQDCHLSYPFLFAHDGRMWMIPESSGRRTVELWEAERFPDRWRLHSVLLDDVDVGDATLAEIDGTWWMFGATRERWCSSWEALALWSAPAPTGPWTAHPGNPVVVDVRSARPAGHLFRDGATWCRPVQDSSRGYGSGLAVAALRELTAETYVEDVVRRFATPPPLDGLHSWNLAGAGDRLLEALDVHGVPAAFGRDRRLALATDGDAGG